MERCEHCGALIVLVGYRHRCVPRTSPITEGKVRKGGVNTFPSQVKERPPAPGAVVAKKKGKKR